MKFITTTPAAIPTTPQPPGGNVAEMTFEERCSLATHPVAKRLFEIMVAKRSNLCVSVDVTTVNEVLKVSVCVCVCACVCVCMCVCEREIKGCPFSNMYNGPYLM